MKKELSRLLRREFRFLARPLNLWSRLLLLGAAAAIVVSLFLPLWRMHLVAPQYSDGLDLFIYCYKIAGGGKVLVVRIKGGTLQTDPDHTWFTYNETTDSWSAHEQASTYFTWSVLSAQPTHCCSGD